MDPLQRYLHFREIFIDKLNQFREEKSNLRLFSVSEGNCGELPNYWNILQISWEVRRNWSSLGNHSDRNISSHHQLASSTRSLSLSLSYSLSLFLSLSLSSYPSYSLLTLGHCDDACLRSALKSRNCCWYENMMIKYIFIVPPFNKFQLALRCILLIKAKLER